MLIQNKKTCSASCNVLVYTSDFCIYVSWIRTWSVMHNCKDANVFEILGLNPNVPMLINAIIHIMCSWSVWLPDRQISSSLIVSNQASFPRLHIY